MEEKIFKIVSLVNHNEIVGRLLELKEISKKFLMFVRKERKSYYT